MENTDSHIILESYIVPPQCEKIRLSDFAPGIFNSLNSNKSTKNAIKKGLVLVNGKRGYSGDYILGGEVVVLLQDEEKKPRSAVDIDMEVCYEDEYLAVVNKPAGLLVSGNKHRTLENALAPLLKKSAAPDALMRPEPIHRLDFPTSGALLVGKTKQAVVLLNKLFEERHVVKKYLAVTMGQQDGSGTVLSDVDGKQAKSEYLVLKSAPSERFGFLNLVQLTLFTGRRHQLRVHMASMGNAILGDAEYGTEGTVLKGKGLYLHSHSLAFEHPITREKIRVEATPPKKFDRLFDLHLPTTQI